jgi:hypothetical protein
MVQAALVLLQEALSALLARAVLTLVLLTLLFVALLLFALFDRGRFHDALRWVGRRGAVLGTWALALLALGVGVLAADIAHRSVQARLGSQVSARYTNSADPDTSETVQLAPSATYLTERTYTRTLVIPPELLRLVRKEGVQVLAPYLQDPSSENIVRLRDRFTRSGQDVVFSRQATLVTQQYITLDTSKVVADLNFVDAAGGRQSYYNAAFGAQYSFKNPLKTPADLRFTFPLPNGSGTLSGFTMTVNGVAYTAADLSSGGNTWEGTVPVGGAVNVRVTYRHQGSRGWNYNLSQRREPVKNFDLTLRTNQDTKYQRYSLFPTRVERAAFGGAQTLHWQLQNAITAQNVAVVFGQGSLRETLNKLYAFVPFALLLGSVLLVIWAALRRLLLPPLRLALALLGLSLGFVFGGVLTGYLLPAPAEVLGAALGLGLAVVALGRAYLLPLLLTVLAPLTFLSVGNAGLLLGLLALTGLLMLLVKRPSSLLPMKPVPDVT